MALYRYEALDTAGRTLRGTLDAGTPAEARAGLRASGLHATHLEDALPVLSSKDGKGTGARRPFWQAHRLDLLSEFSRHLAMLLKAGLPLAQALGVLAEQLESRNFREIVKDLSVRVREGAALDEALAVHPAYFPELFICVARSGAASGELGKVLGEVAHYYTRQKRLRDRVLSAMTYPALMCSIGFLVLVFLLAFVVPRITSVLLEQHRALPWPTEVLLALSGFVQDWWWALLLAFAFCAWIFTAAWRSEKGRLLLDRLVLALPVLGDLICKQAIARWADTMSNLLSSGIPVAQALAVVRDALGNQVLAQEAGRLEKGVLEGTDLSEVLKASVHLPPSIGFAVGVGEESGELARVLREVAQGYHEEVELAASRLADLVSPILIVFLGLVVGFIVAAILLPITDFANVQ